MKILDKEQIYEADRQTLSAEQIPSEVLMERAASLVFDWLHQRLQGAPVNIHVFCGIGNNGGDGLVVARHLVEHGYRIQVYVVKYSENRSDDFLLNLERLKERKIRPEYLDGNSDLPQVGPTDLIVDAVFGIGLNRPPDPWVSNLFEHLNNSGAFILGIDMASGLYMDKVPENARPVLRSDHLLTFGAPKLVFFLPQTGEHVRQFEVLDIGLDKAFMDGLDTAYELLLPAEMKLLYRPRKKFSHKGTYGHVLILGGSHGKIGAVGLGARAALLSGAGLVTACVPECGYVPLQAQLPEIMVWTTPGQREHTEFPEQTEGHTIAVGMGLGTSQKTQHAFLSWLSNQNDPLLLDADALNILSMHPDAVEAIPPGSILTPHPGELRRLIGPWKDDFEKLQKAQELVNTLKCILLIKGAHTLILSGNKTYVNSSGNPGMATAGSGDVLSGLITGLLAQGYPPVEAAILGVFLHGRAGDLMAYETGQEALTATGILNGISAAFMELAGGGDISRPSDALPRGPVKRRE
ncbi:MAG: NAD(P)H-hydrate dehydratase [Robiginitalea sp.]